MKRVNMLRKALELGKRVDDIGLNAGVTSPDLAKALRVSLQTASSKLARYWDIGLMERDAPRKGPYVYITTDQGRLRLEEIEAGRKAKRPPDFKPLIRSWGLWGVL